jgi:hypothetical protein
MREEVAGHRVAQFREFGETVPAPVVAEEWPGVSAGVLF